jgi:Fe-S cluster assembly iron-binding protein IscA
MGGCDIVQELYSSGELQTSLGVAPAEAPNPKVTVTEAAAEALKRTLQEMGGEGRELHLGIDARYQGSLFFAPRLPEELAVEASGFTLLMDPMTASRASGVGLDVVETPQGYSFRIDNPNAPEVPE